MFGSKNSLIHAEISRTFKDMATILADARCAYADELTKAHLPQLEKLKNKLWKLDADRRELWTKREYYREVQPPEDLYKLNRNEFSKVMTKLGMFKAPIT